IGVLAYFFQHRMNMVGFIENGNSYNSVQGVDSKLDAPTIHTNTSLHPCNYFMVARRRKSKGLSELVEAK
ncbi:hypothetical protein EBS67_11860, partial [bacterium]|nr:hypothetical protein [bacterium]